MCNKLTTISFMLWGCLYEFAELIYDLGGINLHVTLGVKLQLAM